MFQWLETHDPPGESYPYVEVGSSVNAIDSGFRNFLNGRGGQNLRLEWVHGRCRSVAQRPRPRLPEPPPCRLRQPLGSPGQWLDNWRVNTVFCALTPRAPIESTIQQV
jgi:hypothetical protein